MDRDPSSSSAGAMPPPLLLPLRVVPSVAAVITMPVAMMGSLSGGMVAAGSCGDRVVGTVVLPDRWNGRYGILAALIMGMPAVRGPSAVMGLPSVVPACCEGPAFSEGPVCSEGGTNLILGCRH